MNVGSADKTNYRAMVTSDPDLVDVFDRCLLAEALHVFTGTTIA